MVRTNNWISKSEFEEQFCKELPEVICDTNKYNENLKVQVLLNTYNQVEFIKEAIDSILMQETSFEFTLLLCDDGSSDGTTEVCRSYQEQHPEKIKLIVNKRINNIKILGRPCGIHSMVNGFMNLTGEYFAILSGDDYWTDPLKLQKQHDYLNEHSEYSYSIHSWVLKNEMTGELSDKPMFGDMPQTLFAKNVFQKIPKEFLSILQEDTFLKAMLDEVGKKVIIRDIKPAVYRTHGSNIWGKGDSLFKWESRVLTWSKIVQAFYGSEQHKGYKKNLLESLVGKDDFLVKSRERNRKRINFRFLSELVKHRVLLLFVNNVLRNLMNKNN